ncbi:hypothetical protein [Pedobacter sp. Hv1]|uniref:hypothetical protein n=1 Tax=Pedobacter sp. Hv1 TaxID=1740090 RepID=UPI0006D8B814|nr:hypothetical protein [Pedobacter sp. Hv1]KQC01330.1 hypothetical protein AQF98_06330 [Pedobacter sp. Hv1]
MKTIIFYAALAFIITLLPFKKNEKSSEDITTLEVQVKGQFFLVEQNLFRNLTTRTSIGFKDEDRVFVVYKIRENRSNQSVKLERKIEKDTIVLYYLINKNSSRGLVYGHDRVNQFNGRIFNLDSLLLDRGIDSNNFRVLSLDLGQPAEIIQKDKYQKMERYLFKKTTTADPDSIIRHYDSQFKKFDFTFSNSLDRINDSKLVKTQIIYNGVAKQIAQSDVDIPRREMIWEMKTDKKVDKKLLAVYFKKFKTDSENLKLK